MAVGEQGAGSVAPCSGFLRVRGTSRWQAGANIKVGRATADVLRVLPPRGRRSAERLSRGHRRGAGLAR